MDKDIIPKELSDLKQWVCWRLEPAAKGGKDTKIPYDAMTGRKASSTNPQTWTTLSNALAAKDKYLYTGVGFVFAKGSNIVGVDIDHCIDLETGELNKTAAEIVEKVPKTYIEISPSGTGLHIFLNGTMPEGGSKNSKTGVEMYAHSRYFTMTGVPYKDTTSAIATDNGVLRWIHDNYIKPPKTSKRKTTKARTGTRLTDEDLFEKVQQSGDSEAFSLLWKGEWRGGFASQSEADLSLCSKLAFWCGKDKEQMDRLFRKSALFRSKWDERHHANGATYGEETLVKAINSTENVYSPESAETIFEYEGRYYRAKGEKIYPITNFLFKPIEMIVSEDETQLTAELVTVRNETYTQTFMTTDFSNLQKFKNILNRKTIALSYLGSEGDLELLKGYVSDMEWEKKIGVKASGIYEHNGNQVFVSADGAVKADGAVVLDIVQLEKYRAIVSDILSCKMLEKQQLKDLGKWLLSFNEPAKSVSVLAWTAGCFIKTHLKKSGVKFPHLFLIGEAGSGKSNTLERIILPIFSRSKVTAATQITAFTLMKESASSNMIPQPLDEFKPSKIDKIKLNALYNHFRDSYDGHEGVRGRADQSTVTFELLAPLIVAGEESADEAAVRERSIELLFSKKDIKNAEYKTNFKYLCAKADLLGSLGRSLLDMALMVKSTEVCRWYEDALGKFSEDLPARVVSNLACAYAGLRLIENLCRHLGFTWAEVFPFDIDACGKYLEYGVHEYLLDGGENNKSVVEQTFEIMSRMGLDAGIEYDVSPDEKVLSLWMNHVYDRYTKYRKDYAIFGEVLTYAQFKKQLEHSDFFLAKNIQKRIGSDNRKVWTVDYEILKARCDVSGFISTGIKPL